MSAVLAVCLGLVAATLFGAASVLKERSTEVTWSLRVTARRLRLAARRPTR
jgi:hypothetical protein